MFKSLLLLTITISMASALHITKMSSEVTVLDAQLPRNEPLHLQGFKKISKAIVEHVILKNCSGVIDEATFKHFPKLSKLTLWRSNIEEIGTTLPVTRFLALGSHIPDLNADLQEKLPKLQAILLLGNKNFEVNPLIFKNFKHLEALHISEANFTEGCLTKEWFKGMDSLQELGLSDNAIACLTDDAFNSLKSLKKLDLTYNHIASLERKLLKKLTKLEKLGLYKNDLERLDLGALASQRNHLEELGVSWDVLRESNISAEDLFKALPSLKFVSFGHKAMPNDFKAGEFCQILRQRGVECEIDSVFGVAKILGYSKEGSVPC